MKFLIILLLFFVINCSSEPSKENLIENCSDDKYTDGLLKYGKVDYAYGLWVTDYLSFKDKYDALYKYRFYTRNCETNYENANVSFKLKYVDFKTKSKEKYNKIRKELNEVENKKLDGMIKTIKTTNR